MAGRGRGRGKGLSFNFDVLGFGRGGECLPPPILQPPPLFPPCLYKPVPLLQGEEYDYMLALKQEFQETLRESPFYLKPPEKKTDIERYSDKYQLNQLDGNNTWNPDWRRFPSELKWDKKKAKKVRFSPKPNISSKKPATATVLETLEKLEKNDVADEDKTAEEGGGDRAKDDDDEEEGEEEEYYEEDDLEEDTDYNLSYFDNGEEYGDNDDDDADEGPIY